ncbi:hypothetical protein BDV35DRAFT_399201 [Aspergillus flavus]|uniref:Uncharacterized protein n=1 Tax=Aspergillus flavus TaxID=5059 RepID=A0A5N6GFB7_ASPFL|nr:hypothetical protein BDV35DRAFT_399201 [Aspergillus flavus]
MLQDDGRYQLSLEHVLDFSAPFTLAQHPGELARVLVPKLIDYHDPERISQDGYKPVGLVLPVFDYVAPQNVLLMIFLLSLYKSVSSTRSVTFWWFFWRWCKFHELSARYFDGQIIV